MFPLSRLLMLLTIFSASIADGAVVIRSGSFSLYPDNNGIAQIDLNGDSTADIQIDTSFDATSHNDGAFLLNLLGDAQVAVIGNITQSFAAGQVVRPADLIYASAPARILTGGVVADALGNPISEGWGGCTYDDLGNVICPPGGPTNQIDLFFVDLGSGFAWIDLDTKRTSYLGVLDAQWGYQAGAASAVTLIPVPEPSIIGMIGLALLVTLRRQRPNQSKISWRTNRHKPFNLTPPSFHSRQWAYIKRWPI